MYKFYKTIRVITIAPIVALVMLVILYINKSELFSGILSLIYGIIFLSVLPILAYPLQKYIPGYKNKGRDGQRSLAIVFAVCGYILGIIYTLCFSPTKALNIVYWEYLISGVIIFTSNKYFGLHVSGHSCGIFGPIILLNYFGVQTFIPGIIILALACFASVKMKRHSIFQLLLGAIVPVIAFVIILFIYYIPKLYMGA